MRLLIILFITSFIYGQSDFILPSDFADNPPNLPNIILPSFDDNTDSEIINDIDFTSSVKGYRIQVMISEDEKDLASSIMSFVDNLTLIFLSFSTFFDNPPSKESNIWNLPSNSFLDIILEII